MQPVFRIPLLFAAAMAMNRAFVQPPDRLTKQERAHVGQDANEKIFSKYVYLMNYFVSVCRMSSSPRPSYDAELPAVVGLDPGNCRHVHYPAQLARYGTLALEICRRGSALRINLRFFRHSRLHAARSPSRCRWRNAPSLVYGHAWSALHSASEHP
jgi:hypothetical protein